jgi:hypothetical protein
MADNDCFRRTGAIRQAAGRGVTANVQLIAMRFTNRAPHAKTERLLDLP